MKISLVFGFIFLQPIVTDETRAGERGVNPFELREMLSGEGTYDSGHFPRVVLWRSGSASLAVGEHARNQGNDTDTEQHPTDNRNTPAKGISLGL